MRPYIKRCVSPPRIGDEEPEITATAVLIDGTYRKIWWTPKGWSETSYLWKEEPTSHLSDAQDAFLDGTYCKNRYGLGSLLSLA